MVDDLLSTRIGYTTRTALQIYTKEFKKKAQEERKLYIDVVEKLVKDIIKDEVKSQLPHILPKEIPDFATLMIQSTVTETLENVVLAKSSSQSQSTYEAATSLTEFGLKKILLDKLEKSKPYQAAEAHKNLYDALVKSYQLDKDLFNSYGKAYSIKRSREDKDKDEDPPARPDQGTKSQPKSSGKSLQAEEPVFETADTEMPQDLRDDMGNTEDQPNVEAASKHDWFKKPKRPLTPDPDCNYLVGPTFNLLKGTCKSQVELEYHFEECYKAITDRVDWTNLEGHQYTFDLSKPLPLIEVQVTHVKVMKKYDYGYLEEIEVRRDDNTLHKFKEGNFPNLNLRDIEDMPLILVQNKISNLERDVIFDLNVALWIFTRSIVILKRVEDLQLGVESY
ncbi:hypothetical protein Tco_0990133 [Tanacetum coccineum]|uniref:Uncharacterized protein n=1 Tax=Tanacetum coccineum TaxID=301880 RepID=A0ABQ5EW24_9ASTR